MIEAVSAAAQAQWPEHTCLIEELMPGKRWAIYATNDRQLGWVCIGRQIEMTMPAIWLDPATLEVSAVVGLDPPRPKGEKEKRRRHRRKLENSSRKE